MCQVVEIVFTYDDDGDNKETVEVVSMQMMVNERWSVRVFCCSCESVKVSLFVCLCAACLYSLQCAQSFNMQILL